MDDADADDPRILDLIDAWHDGQGRGTTLAQFLGLTPEEYARYLETGLLPIGYEPPEPPMTEGRAWATVWTWVVVLALVGGLVWALWWLIQQVKD